jgi:CBS domain-containing protein
MTSSAPTKTRFGGTGITHDATDERYRSMLQYLGAVARERSEERARSGHVSRGPKFVADVMATSVVAAHEDAVFKEIVQALARNRVSALPVVDKDRHVLGVVSESDLLVRVSGRLRRPRGHLLSRRSDVHSKSLGITARELMTSPAVTTTPGARIADAARHAGTARVRRMPVVDHAGRLVGIVSRTDLLRPFVRPDEEIRADVVENVLHGRYPLEVDRIEIGVAQGVVTVRGQVELRVLRETILEAIRAVSGVVDVDAEAFAYRIDDTWIPAPRAAAP